MREIYVDENNRCHVSKAGTMTVVVTDHFDGKCDEFVEGHCCVCDENSVTIWPFKPFDELDEAQRQYEKEQLADMQAALKLLGVSVDG